ncbi:hypothetical protein [Streptosporangium pseudovulgare]|uniref:Uncharacterized protein n=1 Tax=Streptosporangium pseudovulgare TaxID=35765 RepID=A0ABQ2QPJ2_9ACTN|nr:hypothetical protein [Streptosporangium pseudovulgare]GGP87813.1 hypothetical protein GCM10010140_16540 [Streptosporangium pseudovulgare]
MNSHFTVVELRERGWSPAMIRALLDPPDQLAPNPVFRSAAPMRLYEAKRVLLAEETEAFTALRARAERRSRTALLAAERRRGETLAGLAAVPVTVPVVAWNALARKAVDHRNHRDTERARHRPDHVPDPARVTDVDESTLRRWVVNYLRHELTVYDGTLGELFGKVGRAEATRLLRRRIYEAIARTYPQLADECGRQLRLRERDAG